MGNSGASVVVPPVTGSNGADVVVVVVDDGVVAFVVADVSEVVDDGVELADGVVDVVVFDGVVDVVVSNGVVLADGVVDVVVFDGVVEVVTNGVVLADGVVDVVVFDGVVEVVADGVVDVVVFDGVVEVVTDGVVDVMVPGGVVDVMVPDGVVDVMVPGGVVDVLVPGGVVDVVVPGGVVDVVVPGGVVDVVVTGGVVDVVVCVGAAHLERVMVLVSSVTAPFRASSLPWIVAPVWAVIDVKARTVPTKVEPVPRVAELPTCQKTLHACAPPIRATVLFVPVISVLAAWKMNTAFGSPWASSVTVPFTLSPKVFPAYRPATSVRPARSAGTAVGGVRPAASL